MDKTDNQAGKSTSDQRTGKFSIPAQSEVLSRIEGLASGEEQITKEVGKKRRWLE
jgi:hypothetical protein